MRAGVRKEATTKKITNKQKSGSPPVVNLKKTCGRVDIVYRGIQRLPVPNISLLSTSPASSHPIRICGAVVGTYNNPVGTVGVDRVGPVVTVGWCQERVKDRRWRGNWVVFDQPVLLYIGDVLVEHVLVFNGLDGNGQSDRSGDTNRCMKHMRRGGRVTSYRYDVP